jgi:serine/threonine protein kinase
MVEIIGTGTYGCVAKPSLTCKNNTTKKLYKNKVSKLLNHIDANIELNEMELISNVKNIKKYIVSVPHLCEPEQNSEFRRILKQCTSSQVRKTKNPDDLRLLLLDDGGVNLHDIMSMIHKFSETEVNCFLTSILKLFQGIKFFYNHNIIHKDIKLANIVYNVSTGEIKFIDFGLVEDYTTFVKNSMNSTNDFAQSWEYYPKEFSCINQDVYNSIPKCHRYKKFPYKVFVKKAADTFDSYCLSYALKYFFEYFYHRHTATPHIQKTFWAECFILMSKYCHVDVFKRASDLSKLYKEYKSILKSHNLVCAKKPKPSRATMKKASQMSIHNYPTNSNSPSNEYLTPEFNSNNSTEYVSLIDNKNSDCTSSACTGKKRTMKKKVSAENHTKKRK